MDPHAAEHDLKLIHDLVDRTHRRIDPHAFHYVHWGLIVLLWYPLANWFALQGHVEWVIGLGVGSVLLGFLLSGVREARLNRLQPRLPGENTFITRQVNLIVAGCIGAGMVLSGLAPSLGFIDGHAVPTMWGIVYANMAFMVGVTYERDFLWAGLFIFAGVILAIIFQTYNGYILGPFMGLGMIIPGMRAERRVRRMRAEDGDTRTESV